MPNQNESTPVVETPVVEATTVAKTTSKLPMIIIPVALVALIVVGIVFKVTLSTPKHVFKSTVNNIYKEIHRTIKETEKIYEPSKEAIKTTVTLKAKTDFEAEDIADELGLEIADEFDISDFEVTASYGFDFPNKSLMGKAELKGKSEKIDGSVFLDDGNLYLQTSLYDDPIAFDLKELGLEEVVEIFDEIDKKQLDYAIYDETLEALFEAVEKSFDSEDMSKSKEEIEVLDKELKVTEYTYKLTAKSIVKLGKDTIDILLEDDGFIKNISTITGEDKKDIKDVLKEAKDELKDLDTDSKTAIKINVFTRGLTNKFAGISMEVDKEEIFYYYTDGKNIEAEIPALDLKLTIEKNKKEYEVTLKEDKEKILTATVRKFDENEIDLDYSIPADIIDTDEDIEGTIFIKSTIKNNKMTGEYKFRIESGNYIEISGEINTEASKKLEGFSTKDAVDMDDVNEDEIRENLKNTVKEDEAFTNAFGDAFEEKEYDINCTSIEEGMKVDTVIEYNETTHKAKSAHITLVKELTGLETEEQLASYKTAETELCSTDAYKQEYYLNCKAELKETTFEVGMDIDVEKLLKADYEDIEDYTAEQLAKELNYLGFGSCKAEKK